jgi:IclR family transcriptional regulator, KDG regulon repressor
MKNKRKIIGSVQRAIDILNLFDKVTSELGITEIARALDLPKSTAAGLIYTLEENGYLDQNPNTRKYRLGFKLAERTGILLSQFDLRKIATPILQDLRDNCNESVNLGIRDDNDIVYIERIHGHNMLGIRSEIGKRERIHSTALGKTIISTLPEAEIDLFLENYDFLPVTIKTITNRNKFLDELLITRQRGFALDDQENEIGGRCVAAPIFDLSGKAVAAISISVPFQRMPDSLIDHLGHQVLEAAQEISRQLGAAIKEKN